jgi:outer membrane protein assembly factor BamA
VRAQRWAACLPSCALVLALAAGCRTPTRPFVSSIEIQGLRDADPDEIEDGLSTAESPRLFGIVERVLEYATYDRHVLSRDLARIERALRARGYYEAKVTSARVIF